MNTCDNIKNIMVSEWNIYKVYAVWFHSDEVQEQTKLTYGDRVKKVVAWVVRRRWEVGGVVDWIWLERAIKELLRVWDLISYFGWPLYGVYTIVKTHWLNT